MASDWPARAAACFELIFDPAERVIHRPVVEPVAHAQREEILAAVDALVVEPQVFQRGARELGQLDGKEPVAVERMVFERVRRHLRLAQIESRRSR
jgi:hypothetical protein